ncbi:S-layer homology domain-containing protein [Paenibacillus sp. GCM10027626]|uniref:S-layer homology domain-containing protein n=1 Tax=Paenibacillus sp. GCM10027626 TaxID=3273411 RepID=UPI00363915C0
MKNKWKQGMTALALSSVMALSLSPVSAGASAVITEEKMPAWAEAEIAQWKALGLLKGNEAGMIKPNDSVKKSEFITFINRVFNYSEKSDRSFPDVPASAWYAPEIAKAVAAGALEGDANGKIAPLDTLTREQAALILFRVFFIPGPGKAVMPFQDDADIAAWSRESVYAMKEAGYLAGTPGGAFQPKKKLTRAEAVKMINNVMGKLVAEAGTHSNLSGRNLVVNSAGTTLSAVSLSRDLYITAGAGEGDVTIENADIGGTIYVNGGGIINLNNVKAERIVVNNRSASVRAVLSGNSSVSVVDVISEAQVDNTTDNSIESFNIESAKEVGVSGLVKQLNVNAAAALTAKRATIGSLTVSVRGGGSRIALDDQTKVDQFIAHASTTVTGEGTIAAAEIQASGVSLAKKPGKLKLDSGEVKIGGETVTKGYDSTSGTGTPGGFYPGTGDPGTNPPVDQPTRLFSYDDVRSKFANAGAEGLVKQYLAFLDDPTYTPSIASPGTSMPDFTNAVTFVNAEFNMKPSIFASLRNVNTSVLDEGRTTLWIGTDSGVTKISLANNAMKSYTKENKQLPDDTVLLLIADGSTGVYAITKTGVAHIYQ